MTWFKDITGFVETDENTVRKNLFVEGEYIISRINGKMMRFGSLEIPSLADLRGQAGKIRQASGKIKVREIIADAKALHLDTANENALFQVASQFNLLEMISPKVSPEKGVSIYEKDGTQGPACAIAAGAGTIYRNYFVPLNGLIGQYADHQIDCLLDMGEALGNVDDRIWWMRNGYALLKREGLRAIYDRLEMSDENERDTLRQTLRIGIQWNTQVTLAASSHLVSQAYCSALPVAYLDLPYPLWEPFALLVLEASYEAAILAGIINKERSGNPVVYLTLIGGGAFGNDPAWIMKAITRSLRKYADYPLDVAIVSHRNSNPDVCRLASEFS